MSQHTPLDGLRTPPQSVEAECAVIGGILLRNDAFHQISGWLTEDDFYRRDHRLIFRAITEVLSVPRDESDPADAVTLGQWLEERGLSEQIGGPSYLIDLACSTPSAANIVAYAEIVREKSLLRKLIEQGTVLVNHGFQPDGRTSREIAAESTQALQELSGGARPRGPASLKDIGKAWYAELNARMEAGGKLLGLATPWAKFNALTAGFQPGQLIILAARPSMGKSAFAINAALAAVMRDPAKRVMFFNLEMSAQSIYSRAVGCLKDVPLEWFREPKEQDDEQWGRVAVGVRELQDRPLIIDDSPALTFQQMVSRAKREHLRAPLDMVIIDHLHLLPLPGKTRETVEIGNITAAAKGLAKSLGCPVLLLSQLNRGVEQRANKRPVMADLRESGNIEQDADLIVFLYRDDYYAEAEGRESEAPGMVEIIVAKQRDGRTGKVWGRFRAEVGRIEDADACEIPLPREKPKFTGIRGGKDRALGNDA